QAAVHVELEELEGVVARRGVAGAQPVVGAAEVDVRVEQDQDPEDALDLLVARGLDPSQDLARLLLGRGRPGGAPGHGGDLARAGVQHHLEAERGLEARGVYGGPGRVAAQVVERPDRAIAKVGIALEEVFRESVRSALAADPRENRRDLEADAVRYVLVQE